MRLRAAVLLALACCLALACLARPCLGIEVDSSTRTAASVGPGGVPLADQSESMASLALEGEEEVEETDDPNDVAFNNGMAPGEMEEASAGEAAGSQEPGQGEQDGPLHAVAPGLSKPPVLPDDLDGEAPPAHLQDGASQSSQAEPQPDLSVATKAPNDAAKAAAGQIEPTAPAGSAGPSSGTPSAGKPPRGSQPSSPSPNTPVSSSDAASPTHSAGQTTPAQRPPPGAEPAPASPGASAPPAPTPAASGSATVAQDTTAPSTDPAFDPLAPENEEPEDDTNAQQTIDTSKTDVSSATNSASPASPGGAGSTVAPESASTSDQSQSPGELTAALAPTAKPSAPMAGPNGGQEPKVVQDDANNLLGTESTSAVPDGQTSPANSQLSTPEPVPALGVQSGKPDDGATSATPGASVIVPDPSSEPGPTSAADSTTATDPTTTSSPPAPDSASSTQGTGQGSSSTKPPADLAIKSPKTKPAPTPAAPGPQAPQQRQTKPPASGSLSLDDADNKDVKVVDSASTSGSITDSSPTKPKPKPEQQADPTNDPTASQANPAHGEPGHVHSPDDELQPEGTSLADSPSDAEANAANPPHGEKGHEHRAGDESRQSETSKQPTAGTATGKPQLPSTGKLPSAGSQESKGKPTHKPVSQDVEKDVRQEEAAAGGGDDGGSAEDETGGLAKDLPRDNQNGTASADETKGTDTTPKLGDTKDPANRANSEETTVDKDDIQAEVDADRVADMAAAKAEDDANRQATEKPLCPLFESITDLDPKTHALTTQWHLSESERTGCAMPAYMRLEVSSRPFTASAAGEHGRACVDAEELGAEQIAEAEATRSTYSLRMRRLSGDALIPDVDYYSRLQACRFAPSSAASSGRAPECVYVDGADRAFHRSAGSASSDLASGYAAVRLHLSRKVGAKGKLSAREVAVDLPNELLAALQRTGASELADVPSDRLVASLLTGGEVLVDVFPPAARGTSKVDASAEPAAISAADLAERVRCVFGLASPDGSSSSSSHRETSPVLARLAGVTRAEVIDPCGGEGSQEECDRINSARGQGNGATSTTDTTTTTPPTKKIDDEQVPSWERGSAEEVRDDVDTESDFGDRPPARDSAPSDRSKSGEGEQRPPPSSEVEDEVAGGASDMLASPPGSEPVEDATAAWYDSLGNPLYLLLAVGAVLAVTFWALCLRQPSASSADRGLDSAEDEGDDLEMGGGGRGGGAGVGVEMAPGKGSKGFASISGVDEDALSSSASPLGPSGGGSASGGSSGGGSFSNEREEGSASKFLVSVLISIGIPSFGTAKYCQVLRDNYLSTIEQLKQLDNADWKRLGLPLVIEEALRKTLQEHTNKEGRFAQGAPGAAGEKRAKGLDLKAAKKATPATTGSKKKKGGLSVSALADSPTGGDDDPYTDEIAAEVDLLGSSSAAAPAAESKEKEKKGGKGRKNSSSKKKESLLLAPPEDASPIADDEPAKKADTKDQVDLDSWMDDF